MSAAAHGRDATRPIYFYPPAHPVVGSAWHAAVSCAAGSRGGREQQRRGLAGRGSQQQQQPARTSVQWVPVPSIGQLCQAAEGRGTQCLARPPGGTGSSGAQGPWSEYTAKPQLAAPKGGYGPARPSGRWACPPGGCGHAGGCPVSSGGLAWRGAQAQELSFCTHEQSAGSAFHAICSRHPAFDGTDEHST